MDERQLHSVSTWRRCTERWGGPNNIALSRRPQRRLALWHGQRNFRHWTWIQAGSRHLYVVVSSSFAALWKPTFAFALTLLLVEDGDLSFQAPRRFLSQSAVAPSYAYIFTDHQSDANPVLGVNHSAELPYLFGAIGYSGPPEHPRLSQVMLDYWISFAVSLTPNDGKGTNRALSYTPTLSCTYPDTVFRTSLGDVRRNQGTVSSLLLIGRENPQSWLYREYWSSTVTALA
jgi:hypothetical protein